MALIICPDCGKEISDKSDRCINCGCPINVIKKNESTICNIEGKSYDLTDVLNLISNGKYKDSFLKLKSILNISIKNCLNIIEFIDISETIPEYYEIKQYTKKEESEAYRKILSMKDDKIKQSNTPVSCPKCGSTNIQVVPRKWSLLIGFATKKVDRVCVNCKYRW